MNSRLATDGRIQALQGAVLPQWARDLPGADAQRQAGSRDRLQAEWRVGAEWSLVRVTCLDAIHLSDLEFQEKVIQTYSWIQDILDSLATGCPVRMWNFVPAICQPVAGGWDRYSVFNAGRYAAFTRWFDGGDFSLRLPAASGVDVRGRDFVVHVLSRSEPGRALENDRQRSAYRYSPRYGPIPPCFSRGTIVQAPDRQSAGWILVAGTASVVGEDSVHTGDLAAQVAETQKNLAHLVLPFLGVQTPAEALNCYRELRIYLVKDEGAGQVVTSFLEACPDVRTIEWMPADLCRPELLVEVEGLVEIPRVAPK